APPNQRRPGQAEDSDEAFIAAPDRKGPRGSPRGGGSLFDDMLKKPCPYHKGSVNHTLEQCEMLRKYYNRVATRAKKKIVATKVVMTSSPRWRTPSSSLE